jgi:hypothetical protein
MSLNALHCFAQLVGAPRSAPHVRVSLQWRMLARVAGPDVAAATVLVTGPHTVFLSFLPHSHPNTFRPCTCRGPRAPIPRLRCNPTCAKAAPSDSVMSRVRVVRRAKPRISVSTSPSTAAIQWISTLERMPTGIANDSRIPAGPRVHLARPSRPHDGGSGAGRSRAVAGSRGQQAGRRAGSHVAAGLRREEEQPEQPKAEKAGQLNRERS